MSTVECICRESDVPDVSTVHRNQPLKLKIRYPGSRISVEIEC